MICCSFLCGCAVLEFVTPEGSPSNEEISESYYQTELKKSDAADVLGTIHKPEYELLSQSKRVVASSGQKKKGYKTWFNMVAFDENGLTARRKYLFIVDERPKLLFVEPWEGLRLESEMVLEADVLNKPYTDENARRIAILKQVMENVGRDIDEVESDNKNLAISGMVVHQALETVLQELKESPALARRLSEPAGVKFSHINFDKGRIGILIEDDIVKVKMMLGSFVRYFEEKQQEPQQSEENI